MHVELALERQPGSDPAAWSLELEDVAPLVAAPSIASPPQRALAPARSAAQLGMPQPTRPPDPPAVRTLELRIAQSVDRMAPFTRVGLLTFTIVAMLLLATTVLAAGVHRAIQTLEQLRAGAVEAGGGQPANVPVQPGDPYQQYRLDDVVDVDDDGRHLPQR